MVPSNALVASLVADRRARSRPQWKQVNQVKDHGFKLGVANSWVAEPFLWIPDQIEPMTTNYWMDFSQLNDVDLNLQPKAKTTKKREVNL